MIILGIDPGVATVGYGVVDYEKNRFKPLEYGAIITGSKEPLSNRLMKIHDQLTGIIARYSPASVAVEEIFFNNNQKTAVMVSQGRGVILLAAAKSGVPVFEYTPLQVKQAVAGYGRADKNQVQQMVKVLLCLENIPKPDDTADALAIAICHAHSSSSLRFGG